MIRVNLLRPRISAVSDTPEPGVKPRKRTPFISGYEAALGVLLLAGGATAMFFYFDGEVGGEDPQPAPPAVAADPEDLSADAAGAAESRDAEQADAVSDVADERPAGPAADGTTPRPSDAVSPQPVANPQRAEPAARVANRPPAATSEAPAATTPARTATSPGSPPSSMRLSNLKISNRNGNLKMTLAMSGRPSYNKFQLNGPNRIVIDIANTRVGLRRSNLVQNVDHPLVRRVRVGQFQRDPWVARLVLDVTSFPNLLLFPHSGGLDIQVSKSGQ